jgi:hypothetical protein
MMAVTVGLWLFGKPGHELDAEGRPVEPERIRALGRELHGWLDEVAGALEKLTAAGWEATVMLYDIELWHVDVATEAEARARVEGLGLDPDLLDYLEEVDADAEGEMEEEAGEEE